MMNEISKFGLANDNDKNLGAIIGISLGGRLFSKKNIEKIIRFTQSKYNKILILIIDSIKKYNYMAFENISEENAVIKTEKEGKEYRKAINSLLKKMNTEGFDTSNIIVKNYDEIGESIKTYNDVLNIIEKEYNNNIIFHEDCIKMTEKYIYDKGINEISIAQKNISVKFLLNELALFLLIGIYYENKYCIDIYPGKFPVMENVLNNKYKGFLDKLPKGIIYGHIEVKL